MGIREMRNLACLSSHSNASFSEIKAVLDSFLLNCAIEYDLEVSTHSSFIDGRMGRIMIKDTPVGFIGELHPKILEAWGLENPAVAFEVELNELFNLI
jgi:phenylalanyl-tRNA synthetase beta chain